MSGADEVSASGELGIGDDVDPSRDPMARHALGDEAGLNTFDSLVGGPLADPLVEQIPAGHPTASLAEVGVSQPVGSVDRSTEGLPLVEIRGDDRHPAVVASASVDTMRCGPRRRVAHAPRDPAVDCEIQQHRTEQVDRRLHLREIDVLPLAGVPAMFERRQQGHRRVAG